MYEYSMNKKGHISVNLQKFEDEVPPKHHGNVKFCECKNVKKNSKKPLRAGTTRSKRLK